MPVYWSFACLIFLSIAKAFCLSAIGCNKNRKPAIQVVFSEIWMRWWSSVSQAIPCNISRWYRVFFFFYQALTVVCEPAKLPSHVQYEWSTLPNCNVHSCLLGVLPVGILYLLSLQLWALSFKEPRATVLHVRDTTHICHSIVSMFGCMPSAKKNLAG